MPRSMKDAVQDKDGTDIQIFWTKAKTKNKKTTKQELAKGFTKFLYLIKKKFLKID